MKNKLSEIYHAVLSPVLVFSLVWCLASSFKANFGYVSIAVAVVLFCLVFALVSFFAENPKKFGICVLVLIGTAVLAGVTLFSQLIASFNYFINCVLAFYSKAYPMTSGVRFSALRSSSADLFFVFLAFLLSCVITLSIVRAGRFLPVLIVSLITLTPCFIIVDTLPNVIPLFSVIIILLSLFALTFYRKYGLSAQRWIMPAVVAVITALALVIVSIFPQENYSRYSWQDGIRNYFENLAGFDKLNSGKNDINDFGLVNKSVDLSKISDFEQKGAKRLKVLAESRRTIYLKGMSYALYDNNTWSVMAEPQRQMYPGGVNTFVCLNRFAESTENISVITETVYDYAYVPYYSNDIPDGFSNFYDIYVENTNKLLSYDYNVLLWNTDNYADSVYDDYRQFVYNTYLQIPEKTKTALIEVTKNTDLSWLINPYGGLNENVSVEEAAEIIAEYVKNSAQYSIEVDSMPDGEDFSVWFLTRASKGYCVHFASTAALLLRAYGVPSRYVTGYAAECSDDRWTSVTSNNAHAWVEYYDDVQGWTPLEVTPSAFRSVASMMNEQSNIQATEPITQPTATASQSGDERYQTEQQTTQNNADKNTSSQNPTGVNRQGGGIVGKEKADQSGLPWYFIITIILIVLILAVFIRAMAIVTIRKRRFETTDLNRRAVYIYRELKRVSKAAGVEIPAQAVATAEKAKFSLHKLSRGEVRILKSCYTDLRRCLYKNAGAFRRICLWLIEGV